MRFRAAPIWLLALTACAGQPDVESVTAAARGDKCVAGERRCLDGNTPELCVAQNRQTFWVAQTDCGGDTPICSAGTCVCSDGAGDCQGNLARHCTGGAWQVVETCSGSEPICSAGACVCSEGAGDCQGNLARHYAGGAWQVTETCSGPEPICSAGACVCQEGAGDCQGNLARHCSGGAWQVVETCSGSEICSAGACVCQDGSVECVSETSARKCEGGGWQTYDCDLGCSQGVCRRNTVSEAGVVSCDPSALLSCSGAAPYCDVGDDWSTFSCSPVSTGDSLECDGPNDCPAGTECCKGDYALCGTSCVPEGTCGSNQCFTGLPNFTLCDPSAPSCPGGTSCQRVDWVNPDVLLYGCRSDGTAECQEGSAECVSENTARRCEGGVWQTVECDLGCSQGVCQRNTVSVTGVVSCDPSAALFCSGATPYCDVGDTWSTFSCTAVSTGDGLACDGPNDCPAGSECCKGDYALCGTSCVPEGTCGSNQCFEGLPNFTLCDPSTPSCPGGTTCQRVDWADPDVLLFGCK